MPSIWVTVVILAGVGVAGCGSSSSSNSSASVSTTAEAVNAVSTSSQASSKAAASGETTSTAATAQTTTPVHPSKHSKAEVVDLCRLSIQADSTLAASKQTALLPLCGTAVEGHTSGERKKAAETICLGLIGATSATPASAKKFALKQCKTNAWD